MPVTQTFRIRRFLQRDLVSKGPAALNRNRTERDPGDPRRAKAATKIVR